jgi:hypothetical protein
MARLDFLGTNLEDLATSQNHGMLARYDPRRAASALLLRLWLHALTVV